MSTLRDTFLTGYNRDTSAPYHVRYEAGLQAVADAAKAEVTAAMIDDLETILGVTPADAGSES